MKGDNVYYIKLLFTRVCRDIVLKCTATAGLVVTEFFLDSVLAKSMIALFFLIIFDWFTGIYGARASGEKIKSSKIVRTPIKIGIYFMLITCARIAEYSLPGIIRYLDETIIAFLVLTELISIMENVEKMGYEVPLNLLKFVKVLRKDK